MPKVKGIAKKIGKNNMIANLKEVKRKTASEGAIEALQNYIVNNNLKTGASLPTERELTISLNVSRGIIREALRHFRTLGIINARPQKGMHIIRLIPEKSFDAYMPYIKSDKEKLDKLFQLRMIIEIGMIPFLIEKADEENLKELEDLALAMKNSTMKKRKELDEKFHLILHDIVDNDILLSIYPLMEYFDSIDKLEKIDKVKVKSKTPKEISREHLNIVEALKNKDATRLQNIFKNDHYSNHKFTC
jgi:GntR family transcriptional regulator, transcriptional repressor for pyruvate dehydrogenase complex